MALPYRTGPGIHAESRGSEEDLLCHGSASARKESTLVTFLCAKGDGKWLGMVIFSVAHETTGPAEHAKGWLCVCVPQDARQSFFLVAF